MKQFFSSKLVTCDKFVSCHMRQICINCVNRSEDSQSYTGVFTFASTTIVASENILAYINHTRVYKSWKRQLCLPQIPLSFSPVSLEIPQPCDQRHLQFFSTVPFAVVKSLEYVFCVKINMIMKRTLSEVISCGTLIRLYLCNAA